MQNLSEEIKKDFVDEQFSKIVPDEKQFCRKFFMTPDQLREVHQKGIEIGTHTYSHVSLGTMDSVEQKRDIARSKKILSPSH